VWNVWVHCWWWLEANSFWKTVVGFGILSVLTFLAGMVPWRKHRHTQRQIADSLDTKTPGGLTDLVNAIEQLAKKRPSDDDDADPEGGPDADDDDADPRRRILGKIHGGLHGSAHR
jgi:hypothetical protein